MSLDLKLALRVPGLEACSGCGGTWHKAGRQQRPAYNQICSYCHKVGHFAKVCHSKQTLPATPTDKPAANAIHAEGTQPVQLFPLTQQLTPAPKLRIMVSTFTGTYEIMALPDSGANISAAGNDIMEFFGYHLY